MPQRMNSTPKRKFWLITVRVLRERFAWPPYDLLAVRHRLQKIGRIVEPKETLSITEDEPDNRILECADEAGSEFMAVARG